MATCSNWFILLKPAKFFFSGRKPGGLFTCSSWYTFALVGRSYDTIASELFSVFHSSLWWGILKIRWLLIRPSFQYLIHQLNWSQLQTFSYGGVFWTTGLVVRAPLGVAFLGVAFFGGAIFSGAFLIGAITRAFLGGSFSRDSLVRPTSVMFALVVQHITCLGGVSTLPPSAVEVTTTEAGAEASWIGFSFCGVTVEGISSQVPSVSGNSAGISKVYIFQLWSD